MTEPFKWPGDLHRMIWAGDYWGPNGALAIGGTLLEERIAGGDDHGLSPLSSLYYSAAGNAGAKWKRNPLAVWWARRAKQLLSQAVVASDQLEADIGLSGMNPDELDVRQSILRKARRFKDAERCIFEAMSRGSMQTHTRGLLLIGRAECLVRRGDPGAAYEDVCEARGLAAAIARGNPNQAARIYKGVAAVLRRIGGHDFEVKDARKRAAEFAEQGGAKDQLLKMGAK